MSAPVERSFAREFRFLRRCESGHCPQRGSRGSEFALLLVVLTAFLYPHAIKAQQTKAVRRVLIFNDFSSVSSPGVAALDQAIAAGLESSPYQNELYNENLEATLFSDEASQRRFRDWFIQKYADRKPDVIITVGPSLIPST